MIKKDEMMYIPILKTLTQLLKNKTVLREIRHVLI